MSSNQYSSQLNVLPAPSIVGTSGTGSRNLAAASVGGEPRFKKQCKNGPGCRGAKSGKCPFNHSLVEACHFAGRCTNPKCLFGHPERAQPSTSSLDAMSIRQSTPLISLPPPKLKKTPVRMLVNSSMSPEERHKSLVNFFAERLGDQLVSGNSVAFSGPKITLSQDELDQLIADAVAKKEQEMIEIVNEIVGELLAQQLLQSSEDASMSVLDGIKIISELSDFGQPIPYQQSVSSLPSPYPTRSNR